MSENQGVQKCDIGLKWVKRNFYRENQAISLTENRKTKLQNKTPKLELKPIDESTQELAKFWGALKFKFLSRY